MTSKGSARRPAPSRFFEASTDVVPARHAREFWRFGVLNRSVADFRPEYLGAPYRGRVTGFLGPRSEIRDGRSDPIIMRRPAEMCRRDGGDQILLSAILRLSGDTWAGDTDQRLRLQAGDILVTDFTKPQTIDAGRYREVNFRVSRPLVAAAIRRDPGFLHGRILPKTPLTAMLYANLRDFAEALPEMDDDERAVALEASTEFTLQTLDFVVRRFEHADTPADRLFEAAERVVDRNLGLRRLSPEWLAEKLGCSRSAIYRLFRIHGCPVMEFVAERRLASAFERLADPNNAQTIADIASSCGFDDPSSFSRMFRRRFGCTPGEARGSGRKAPAIELVD